MRYIEELPFEIYFLGKEDLPWRRLFNQGGRLDISKIVWACHHLKVQWLEDSDKENIEKETLEEQYKIVKKETNTSMVDNINITINSVIITITIVILKMKCQVMQFGDMSISKLPVGTFQVILKNHKTKF